MHPLVRTRGLQREVAALWVDGVRWNRDLTEVTLRRRGLGIDPYSFAQAIKADLGAIDFEGATFELLAHGRSNFSRKERELAAFAIFRVRFPDGSDP